LNYKKTCSVPDIDGLHLTCEWYFNYRATTKFKLCT